MADQQNPYVQLGMMGMMMPNPFTQYKGQLPMPGYMGAPTDASGNPIQSFTDAQTAHDAWNTAHPAPAPGTTLNSPGQTYGLQPSDLAGPTALNPTGNQAFGMATWGGMMSPQARDLYRNQQYSSPGQAQGSAPMSNQAFAGQQGAAGGSAGTNPVDMRQAYLTALSNPGKVTTPGANVPQAQPLGQPSVMNSFLSAHSGGGGTGAGNYTNKPFFDTLNQLRSA